MAHLGHSGGENHSHGEKIVQLVIVEFICLNVLQHQPRLLIRLQPKGGTFLTQHLRPREGVLVVDIHPADEN